MSKTAPKNVFLYTIGLDSPLPVLWRNHFGILDDPAQAVERNSSIDAFPMHPEKEICSRFRWHACGKDHGAVPTGDVFLALRMREIRIYDIRRLIEVLVIVQLHSEEFPDALVLIAISQCGVKILTRTDGAVLASI